MTERERAWPLVLLPSAAGQKSPVFWEHVQMFLISFPVFVMLLPAKVHSAPRSLLGAAAASESIRDPADKDRVKGAKV